MIIGLFSSKLRLSRRPQKVINSLTAIETNISAIRQVLLKYFAI